MKKSVLKAILATALIFAVLASYSLYSSIASMLRMGSLASQLMVLAKPLLGADMSKPMPPGTFELSISSDASAFYSFIEMFRDFSADRLEWSTSIPSYPPGTFISFAVDAHSLDFVKENTQTYQLFVKGLGKSEIKQNEVTMFSVQCKMGELEFAFSDSYHKLDITGTLTGDVYFLVNFLPDINFEYSGRELEIDVHMGLT